MLLVGKGLLCLRYECHCQVCYVCELCQHWNHSWYVCMYMYVIILRLISGKIPHVCSKYFQKVSVVGEG